VLELVLRITFSLLVVLTLIWAAARIARRPLARRGGPVFTVLARQQLSRGSSVAVLRVVDRALVLGVTDQQVTLLGETDLAELQRQQQAPGRRSVVLVDDAAGSALSGAMAGLDDQSRLAGSVLSRRTWSRLINFLRDRTERKP
jgi:flagellar protein FliO/FliZ